jgi:hypothetical protein
MDNMPNIDRIIFTIESNPLVLDGKSYDHFFKVSLILKGIPNVLYNQTDFRFSERLWLIEHVLLLSQNLIHPQVVIRLDDFGWNQYSKWFNNNYLIQQTEDMTNLEGFFLYCFGKAEFVGTIKKKEKKLP